MKTTVRLLFTLVIDRKFVKRELTFKTKFKKSLRSIHLISFYILLTLFFKQRYLSLLSAPDEPRVPEKHRLPIPINSSGIAVSPLFPYSQYLSLKVLTTGQLSANRSIVIVLFPK